MCHILFSSEFSETLWLDFSAKAVLFAWRWPTPINEVKGKRKIKALSFYHEVNVMGQS